MLRNIILPISRANMQMTSVRYKQKRVPKVDKQFQAAAESLAARGFLRPNKPWEPPANIDETIQEICSKNGLNASSEFENLAAKFTVLNECYTATGHSVPNSVLAAIETVDDLKKFYNTPVDTKTPFEALKNMELPKNLHVQPNYVRYHPDKDTMFNGVSAYPKSSTIVTGIKTRKKYEGYTAKRSWP